MSQSVVFPANKGTTVRKATDGSPTQGAGGCKRLYVGRYKPTTQNLDYWSFLNFAFSWPASGQIISAILTLSTDDGLGIQGDTMVAADTPKVTIRRLTESFSEKTNSAVFDSDDYETATVTSSDAVTKNVSKGALDATNIDITAIVEDWMPVALKRRNGKAGGNAAKHGIKLSSTTDTKNNAAFISEDAEGALASFEPYITFTYDLGHTTPNTPTGLVPSGAVASIGSFQGTFTDPRATDQLRYSEVQVFDAGHAGTAALNNDITSAGHGLVVGDRVFFTSLTGGAGLTTFTGYYVKVVTATKFQVSATLGGAAVDITNDYSALTWSKMVYSVKQAESNTAIVNGIFDHVPANFHPVRNATYRWRARVYDQEGQVSAYTGLTSFSVSNTDPDAPSLTPADGSSFSSMDGIAFRGGTFTDPDPGDTLLAYEVQLSAYPEGDAHWLDDEFILWSTGKRYRSEGATNWSTPYGGDALAAGTYYWRARQWDNHQGLSDWAYASIILTADFEGEAQFSENAIQMRPRAPWRIVIKAMGTNRGPGAVVAVLEDAMNVGASILYNSPGEAHWTLGAFHPQVSVIEPKQTHYSIQFRQGDGWREAYAGLVDDFDATDTDIIFYGVDYLGLLDRIVDENYVSSNADAAYDHGGSKYSNKPIRTIIADQLAKAKALSDSPVGFINVATVPAALSTAVTIFSTFQPVLNFVVGLLDSYRAGSSKYTRLSVQRTAENAYSFVVTDDPGIARDNLRMRYGELVQGFRVVPFGKEWGTRIAAIGRDKDGVKVRYRMVTAPGISESTWGRFTVAQFFDGISDDNDLIRRARQAIVAQSMLGRQVGLGLRSGVLLPRDGYDLLDLFPVDIEHGAVDTGQFGHDGYWVAVGITWRGKPNGEQATTLTLQPKLDGSAPSSDLLVSVPISDQAEWQVGWVAPEPVTATRTSNTLRLSLDAGWLMDGAHSMDDPYEMQYTGRIHMDVTTGYVSELADDGTWVFIGGPPSILRPSALTTESRTTLNADGTAVSNITVTVT